jgi:phosphoribosylformylglycinamidine (FGAM) synthase PurS component
VSSAPEARIDTPSALAHQKGLNMKFKALTAALALTALTPAHAALTTACEKLLANTVIENYRIDLMA